MTAGGGGYDGGSVRTRRNGGPLPCRAGGKEQETKTKKRRTGKNPAGAGLFLQPLEFTQRRGPEGAIAFDLQPEFSAIFEKFAEAEVAEFPLEAVYEAEEEVVAVEFDGVPRPREVRVEELHLADRVGVALGRTQGRQALEYPSRQKLFVIHMFG